MFPRLPILLLLLTSLFSAARAQESVMVVEAYSGKVLVAANAAEKRPVASLTKIATATVAIDWATATGTDLAKVSLSIPQTASLVGGANALSLQPGETMLLRDALRAALLGSDNIAALAISDHIGRELLARRGKSGDPVAEFVGEMNRLAKSLGMARTRFTNPHGLERPGAKAYSTAADMARLSIYAMRRSAFSFIVRQPELPTVVQGPNGTRTITVRNTNELVGETGILGIKTGTTTASGPCLSVCMDREPLVRAKPDGEKGVTPRRLVVILLNSPDRFNRARVLIQQGWSIYDPWLAAGAPVQDRKREFLSMPQPQ
jgi:D-alanyl-D-alanine carboxypeptidase (penicillin-binding protein 5/6)